ncbi:hypothetical protein OG500_32875 [Kitasatospora sp. NBC_01250]|uniref:hypothetical protein n=1 Tax=unclassified Kitasatospora TaxID=2633591 RepID=UPI002E136460|nr:MULTISPECIES: hypothetical protein [unclassified Kitasatospora]WSJ70781.1 hypothetical protein OG294_34415 [Kitasatospora sp. NBC_01302]
MVGGGGARGAVTAPVRWDAARSSLSVGEVGDEQADGVDLLAFSGLAWLTLDSDGGVMAVDLHDVPDALAVVVPRAARPRYSWNSTESEGAGSWLLDADSGWVWIRLRPGMAHRRLVGTAQVSVWLRDGVVLALRLVLDDSAATGG